MLPILNLEVCLKRHSVSRKICLTAVLLSTFLAGGEALAQSDPIVKLALPVGRAYPLTVLFGITKVSIAKPEVADVVVIGPRELVINSKAEGETDAILWLANGSRQHYRIEVHSPSDRQQVALYIKVAEVRKDFTRNLGLSALYRNRGTRIGTGPLGTDNDVSAGGGVSIPADAGFLTVLTDFGTRNLLALIEADEKTGRARVLAEPNLMAGNRDTATFLAGGELPVPILQPGEGGQSRIIIQYKEFGVRLRFVAEILSDSLVKLNVTPEVSSLDYVNGITLSGFRIPAFRTRRVQTTVDVRRDNSMIISGLFNNEQQKVKSGIPLLKDIPVLGDLISSTSWQNNESELLVVVTPVLIDPLDPRPNDVLRLRPDTVIPARDAFLKRLDEARKRPPSPIIR